MRVLQHIWERGAPTAVSTQQLCNRLKRRAPRVYVALLVMLGVEPVRPSVVFVGIAAELTELLCKLRSSALSSLSWRRIAALAALSYRTANR